MDHSPPKRLTRARAAVKSSDKTAKLYRVAISTSKSGNTSTKRKTRSDEAHFEDCQQTMEKASAPEPIVSRIKTKKIIDSSVDNASASSIKRPTRGRPRKAPIDLAVSEPKKTTRGRDKKTEVIEEKTKNEKESLTKRTRQRPISTIKPIDSSKSVRVEIPDKENIVPSVTSKKPKGCTKNQTEIATGFRAKPVRKPATTRTTRARKPAEKQAIKPSALSPKKPTQALLSNEVSDDELSTTTKTKIEPLKKSPLKASGIVSGPVIDSELPFSSTSFIPNASINQELKGSISSPARRPPHRSNKDGNKPTALRINNSTALLLAPPKVSISSSSSNDNEQTDTKPASLQSPARRPRSPYKVPPNDTSPKSIKAEDISDAKLKPSSANTYESSTRQAFTSNFSNANEATPIDSDNRSTRDPQFLSSSVHNTPGNESDVKLSSRRPSTMPQDTDPKFSPELSSSEIFAELYHEYELPSDHENKDSTVTEVNQSIPSLSQNSMDPFLFSTSSQSIPGDAICDGKIPNLLSQSTPHKAHFSHEIQRNIPTFDAPDFFDSGDAKQYKMVGFTPLAQKLSHWMVNDADKADSVDYHLQISPTTSDLSSVDSARTKNEIVSRQSEIFEETKTHEKMVFDSSVALDLEQNFELVKADQQDLELAMEANELSLVGPSVTDILGSEIPLFGSCDCSGESFEALTEHSPIETNKAKLDTRSETSIENNNKENLDVVDPHLLQISVEQNGTLTPHRVYTERVCHTVYKIPLKPAADDTPMRPLLPKRCASISRPPVIRSSIKSNHISLPLINSESLSRRKNSARVIPFLEDMITPVKQHNEWSNLISPEKTTRSDLDPLVLKGAVILIDVYTSEGSDASAIFTEILTQMGAQCIQSWNSDLNNDESEIEPTHVVFKDGRKSILEKVRESQGRVACVGLGWVLDCERDNEWHDEGPYLVDTDLISGREAQRRMSKESLALKNDKDILIPSTPNRRHRHNHGSNNASFTNRERAVMSKSRRRDSAEWVRPPSTHTSDLQDLSQLPPLPITPCPEGFFDNGGYLTCSETPNETPYFLHKERLLQKTAPVKRQFKSEQGELDGTRNSESGPRLLTEREKNEGIMRRLMTAKRKSLQWAPKVGSPLAKNFYG